MPFSRLAALLTAPILILAALPAPSTASDARFFAPTPGYTRVQELPDSLRGRVSLVEFRIHDAFEGSAAHSDLERSLYDLGNKLHIDTRETTVRRRLNFRTDDSVTVDRLREAEKLLRGEEFLADAILEVRRLPDSTLAVMVTTYDQWTTVPGVSLGRHGGEWVWWLGPVESNLLGTGQRVGFFIGKDVERESRWIDYSNTAFTPWRLRLTAHYSWLSDGSSYAFTAAKPLRSRREKWGFSLSSSGTEFSETLYLSGNELDRLEREDNLPPGGDYFGRTNRLGQWERVATHRAYAGVTRAFGYALKTSITPFYERTDRRNTGAFSVDSALWNRAGDSSLARLDERRDEVLGATFSVYSYAYKTVHNFRNLKWSESIETGWRLSGSAGRNQAWMGADDSDWYLKYAAAYNNVWRNVIFLNSGASVRHFLSPSGEFDHGSVSANAESQWKPSPLTATVATAQYGHLFATPGGERLYLGEESGLLGFPNFYYGGQARLLYAAEQRFFPPLEFGTVVPALAVFLNAGNTWDSRNDVNPGDLHYSAGIGLRLGATRSVQKVVNHINLTWPLGERNLSGPVLGIRAAKSL